MPKLKLEIPEVVNCISRPVVRAIVEDLTKWLNLREVPPIVYLGNSSQPATKGGLGNEHSKYNIFNAEAMLRVEVVEEYPEHLNGTQPQVRPNEIFEFADRELGVYLKPLYQPIHVTMNFNIRTEDQTSANQIMQSWKRHITGLKQVFIHTVGYHYPIPLLMMAILIEVHKAREAVAPYNQDTNTWLKSCFSPKLTVISDVKGANPFFAIRENQTDIEGWYDLDGKAPVFEKEGDGGAWVANLSYQFQYDRVEGMYMEFPLMVHNQMMPLKFVDTEKLQDPEDTKVYRNLTGHLSHYFGEINKPTFLSGEPGLSIPHFDDWLPNYSPPHHQSLVRAIMQVDTNDLNLVQDLSDFGEWVLDSRLLNHIRLVKEGIFHPRHAAILVNLFEGQTMMDHDWLTITDTTIRCTQNLNVRKNYHLVISLNYNLASLSPAAIAALLKDGAFAVYLLQLIEPRLEEWGILPTVNSDGTIDQGAFEIAAYEAYKRALIGGAPDLGSRRTVGGFTLVAHKEIE